MPWFCYSSGKKKHRSSHNRVRVSSVSNDNSNSNRNKNSASRRRDSNNDTSSLSDGSSTTPKFAVVLQDFFTQVDDQLQVARGQVVEVVSADDSKWVHVRNLDGSGYIPKNICCNLDQIKGSFSGLSSAGIVTTTGEGGGGGQSTPQQQVINVDTLPRSGCSATSVEVHQVLNSSQPLVEDSTSAVPAASSSSQPIYEVPQLPTTATTTATTSSSAFSTTIASAGAQPTSDIHVDMSPRPPMLPPRSLHLSSSPIDITSNRRMVQQRPASLAHTVTPGSTPPTPHQPFIGGYRQSPTSSTGLTSQLQNSESCYVNTNGVSLGPHVNNNLVHTARATSQQHGIINSPHSPSSQMTRSHSLHARMAAVTRPQNLAYNNTRPSAQADHLPQGVVAQTPGGTAGMPLGVTSMAASPSSARVALTPGSPGTTSGLQATTNSPGPSGVAAKSRYPKNSRLFEARCSLELTPPHLQRAVFHERRYRRHSCSDNTAAAAAAAAVLSGDLAHSPGSGNSNLGGNSSRAGDRDLTRSPGSRAPPLGVVGRSSRYEQSQPALNSINLQQSSPQQQQQRSRPSVRRSFSMQEQRQKRSMSMFAGTGENRPPLHLPKSVPIRRASSYREAVLSEEERMFGTAAGIKPSELATIVTTSSKQVPHTSREDVATSSSIPSSPISPIPASSAKNMASSFSPLMAASPPQQPQVAALKLQDGGRRMRSRGRSSRSYSSDSCCEPGDGDDVFLPDNKKPTGIYQSTRAYRPKFKGEIALKEHELVIVLDYGRGEWAWVITSSNREGLIPKSVLTRYQPEAASSQTGTGVDVATQTEADLEVVQAATSTTATPTSCSSSNNSSPNATLETPAATTCPAEVVTVDDGAAATSDDVDGCTAVAATHGGSQKEWFDTLDSIDIREDQLKGSNSSNRKRGSSRPSTSSITSSSNTHSLSPTPGQAKKKTAKSPSSSSTMTRPTSLGTAGMKNVTKCQHTVPVAQRRLARSLPQSPCMGGAILDHTTLKPVTPDSLVYHDRISGLGMTSFDYNSISSADSRTSSPRGGAGGGASRASSRSSNNNAFLTAVRDYSPPTTAKNCLSLRKGDVMHSQPHMHYPKGWMWVWHTRKRSFGYVPKAYVAYTYNTPPKENLRPDAVEDAV